MTRNTIDNKKMTVVDSIMGTGKTSWAIQEMNSHPEESYIYCTPFLDELDRIIESCNSCNRKFHAPKQINGRKIEGFNFLLMGGKNIVLTHTTFSNSNSETLEHLSNGNYTLILDEVLDILVDFNKVVKQNMKLTRGDIAVLFDERFIEVDRYGKVSWLKKSYPDAKYSDVERLAKNGNLFYLNETMLVWQFPPQIFCLFNKVYILTYLFEGSFLKPYFEYHKLPYERVSVAKNSSGKYYLAPYSAEFENREAIKKLITILDNPIMNNYKAGSLSKTWFEKARNPSLPTLQKHLYNYFRNITKAKSADIMWTCPKDFKKHLKGRGYICTRQMTKKESSKPTEERDKLKNTLSCFVPCNARATNKFQERKVLAYVCNMFSNPYVKRYFSNKNDNDGTNIHVNEEYLALSCMLQWIWRSQIRDGKPIQIYIPSTRMRNLLIDWLDKKM